MNPERWQRVIAVYTQLKTMTRLRQAALDASRDRNFEDDAAMTDSYGRQPGLQGILATPMMTRWRGHEADRAQLIAQSAHLQAVLIEHAVKAELATKHSLSAKVRQVGVEQRAALEDIVMPRHESSPPQAWQGTMPEEEG